VRNSLLSRDDVVRGLAFLEGAPSCSIAVEHKITSKGLPGNLRKKLAAFTVVTIMVVAGFVILAPTLAPSHAKTAPSNPQENQAGITVGGTRSVAYTISNMFESYLKQSDSTHSWQGATPGLNSWWGARGTYGDVVVRAKFPYVIGYSPYSSEVPPAGSGVPVMKYGLYTFYRITIDAKNLSNIGTGAGKEAAFFPILYRPWTTGLGLSGGWMNFSYYMTYTSTEEESALKSGTSWASSYYKVSGNQFDFQGANSDDGWYIEFQGKVDFNTAAAKKFLGLTGSNSLITQFTANNTGANLGKLNRSLSENWTRDGSNSGFNDTYCSYDYSLNYSPLNFFLSVDPSSSASKLVLRIYGVVWGIEYLMNRYLDRVGLMSQFVTPPEDWYLNGTIAPTGADIFSRYVSVYNMMAWKDAGFYSPAWQMDVVHIDYAPNNALHVGTDGKWVSSYNQYLPSKSPPYKTYAEWSPGTLNYGRGVAYWYPPTNWNLATGENLSIKLPPSNEAVLGYMPYLGTGTQDSLSDAKMAELQAHTVWGEIGLGTVYPNTLRNSTYYNHATKTLTITGPTSFPRNPNAAFPSLNATGSPSFSFDVMRVSNYQMAVQEAGPYIPGQTYHLLMTAKNVTGATVTDWNGTIDLTATAGTTLGASTLWFGPGSNGVVSTTVTFTTNGSKTLTATDRGNSLDVVNSILVQVDPFSLPLTVGWNLVTVPLVGFGYKASSLGLAFGDVVTSWNPATQSYDHNYIKGISPPTADFTIAPNTGYWIWVAAAKTLSLQGVIPTSVQIYTFTVPATGGWIQIGFDSLKTTWKASDITGSGTLTGFYTGPPGKYITLVTKYTGASYISFIRGTPLNNFALVPGAGYWCWAEASGSITYMP
jgi:hypothetical protein